MFADSELQQIPITETILLRAEEVALLLGLGRTKVYEMVAAGELPAVRIGRCLRVPREDLRQWVRLRIQEQADTVIENNSE
jgi:excisionase family DNA binding protein